MSFDRAALRATIAAHGPVARVVVAAVEGSTPREAGAAMLVWADGQSGTIGGGALEFAAAERARAALAAGRDRLDRAPLGPALGQCCGGAVTLLTEVWTAARLSALSGDVVVARPVPGGPAAMPLSVSRLLAAARGRGERPAPVLKDGWMVEPILRPARALWVWGAGHVGRAIVTMLAPIPDVAITWVDTAEGRFPEDMPQGVTRLVASNPADLVAYAPREAEHLILTYSHALDLELCHRLLGHGFAACGLIGSRTKWARFRSRLAALGHGEASIARIRCPIGDPGLGKHPQAIAVGVAHQLLNARGTATAWKDGTG
jgi:xanthine dehydrogenase accessory factor